MTKAERSSSAATELACAVHPSNSAVNGGAINTCVELDSTLRANRAVLVDGVGGAVIAFGAPVTMDSKRRDQQPILRGGGGMSAQASGGHRALRKITNSTVSNNSTIENGGGGIYAFGPERLISQISPSSATSSRAQAQRGGG